MKPFLFAAAVLASSAMAQTTSACAADYIVEACLSSENAKLGNCQHNDYECKCTQWQNILTCFNNCPNDPRLHESIGQKDIFCGYVSQFSSTKTTVPPQSTSIPADETQSSDEDGPTPTNSETSTPTGSDDDANTNSAADLALNAGGVLAAVAGVVAVVL